MAGVAKKRVSVKLITDNYERASNGEYTVLNCCAFVEFSGLDQINSVEDAVAMRRLASGEYPEDDAVLEVINTPDSTTDGMVLATTNQHQDSKHKYLLGAGFTKLVSFIRPGSGGTITLWGATTLRENSSEIQEPTDFEEIVTL